MNFVLARLGARLAFEQLPDPLLLLDPGGNIIKHNAAARRLLSAAADGQPLASCGDAGRAVAIALQALSDVDSTTALSAAHGPGSLAQSATVRIADAVFELHRGAVRASDGELLVCIVRLADVTAARRDAVRVENTRARLAAQVQAQTEELQHLAARLAEERHQLALAEERLLVIEDIAGIGHWSWDARRNAIEFAPGAMRVVDLPTRLPSMDGAVDLGTVVDGDRAMLQARFGRIAAGEPVPVARFGVQVPGEDGPRRFLGPPPAYEHEDGRVVRAIGLLQDITASEQAAATLERMNRELEAEVAARTRELGSIARQLEGFAYMATHDLRAPLRAINGHAAIVQEEFAHALGPDSRAALGEIVQLANRLDALIDDLRVLAVDAACEPVRRRIDLAPLAERLVRDWARGGDPGAPTVQVPGALPLDLDPVRGPMLWRYLLHALCERCAARAPGSAIRLEPGPRAGAVLLHGPFAADAGLLDPLIVYLLERTGARLLVQHGDTVLVDHDPDGGAA